MKIKFFHCCSHYLSKYLEISLFLCSQIENPQNEVLFVFDNHLCFVVDFLITIVIDRASFVFVIVSSLRHIIKQLWLDQNRHLNSTILDQNLYLNSTILGTIMRSTTMMALFVK